MISGLLYFSDWISSEVEDQLIDIIDQQPWGTSLKRRVQQYGYQYDYTKKSVDTSMFLGKLPDWTFKLVQLLVEQKLFTKAPDQLIVNEYTFGQGIAPHIDCVPCFGETVASLSLGSTCAMDLEHKETHKKGSIMLAPRSLLVLSGEARYDWTHSIPARKEDTLGDQVFPRSRRISLTFRTVIKDKK